MRWSPPPAVPSIALARSTAGSHRPACTGFCWLTGLPTAVHLDFGVRGRQWEGLSPGGRGCPQVFWICQLIHCALVTPPGLQPHGHLHPAPPARHFVKNLRRQHPGKGLLPLRQPPCLLQAEIQVSCWGQGCPGGPDSWGWVKPWQFLVGTTFLHGPPFLF